MEIESPLGKLLAAYADDDSWQPAIFDLGSTSDRNEVERLASSGLIQSIHDTVARQLEDLLSAREPSWEPSRREIARRIDQHLEGKALLEYGRWVHYPWSGRMVHVLPEGEFRELRSDRNRHKITRDEQEILRGAKIGFVGLSVGQIIATTMALEGIGGELRLADMDTLDLSNLNRLHAGIHDLGVRKTVISARRILEFDPYIDIRLFDDGVTPENMDRFLLEDGKLDLIIDECDDLYAKIRIRERAREVGIPVIMDTCDRGLIDIERFDREPGRPLFHGLAGDLDAESLKGLTTVEKLPYVLRISGSEMISDRGAASIVEIGQTLSSLPQLASGVTMGAGKSVDAARRILLGEFTSSGRYYVDLAELVGDGTGEQISDPGPVTIQTSPLALATASCAPLSRAGPLTHDAIRSIVGHGILAPSAGNCQPWRFTYGSGTLGCMHDEKRSSHVLDFRHLATAVAFGAAAENMSLAAAALGRRADIVPFPDPGDDRLVCTITFPRHDAPHPRPELIEQVPLRVTNRKQGGRRPLDDSDAAELRQAAVEAGGKLRLLADEGELDGIGAILGGADRLQLMCEATHGEMMGELRWSPGEVEATRDGIDVATMEFTAADAAAVRIISSWPAMKALGRFGGGRALEKPARKSIASASAVALLTIRGTSRPSYFEGGKVLERVWLTATARGLSIHPMSGICYLFARLERGGAEVFTRSEIASLEDLRRRYLEIFDVTRDDAELLLFRIGYADPPAARSLRRRVEDVLTFEG